MPQCTVALLGRSTAPIGFHLVTNFMPKVCVGNKVRAAVWPPALKCAPLHLQCGRCFNVHDCGTAFIKAIFVSICLQWNSRTKYTFGSFRQLPHENNNNGNFNANFQLLKKAEEQVRSTEQPLFCAALVASQPARLKATDKICHQ